MQRKEVKGEERENYVRWFSELGKADVKVAGGKGANLGEMYNTGMPVPQGFVILASAYEYFLEETGLKEKIYSLLASLDVEDTKELDEKAGKIKEMVVAEEMPADLREEIIEAYDNLSFDKKMMEKATFNVLSILKVSDFSFVAVRSSATAEDTEKASFAGQQETFLNVKGKEALIENVKKCWASLFTPRSIYYRVKKGFRHEDVLIAVIVQLMINSDKSGVIFSRDPVSKEENVVIEAVFGLGEGIVSGRIQPDHYTINRELKILDKKIADKKIAIIRDSAGQTKIVPLTEERSKQQVLSDYEVKRLADYALELEEHYKLAQDIEFAISAGEIFIVQTRPVTTLYEEKGRKEVEGKLLLEGLAASPGIGSGEVKVIFKLEDLAKIKKGDVLVTKMTNPDMVVSMQKCSAIVTDEGGITAHAAIISREMGIPAVVGTKKATEVLKDGQIITVDGFKGKIYEGKGKTEEKKVEIKPIIKTETKIKVMVDLPDFAERASKTLCREVGLLRLEGIIAESGKHPFYFLKQPEKYEEIIFTGIKKIAEYFDELWIRTSDIRSDEFRHLEGARKETELNPMLGMHGIRAGLKNKEILEAELKAMKKLSGEKIIGIMMPQVISVEEVKEVKKMLQQLDFKGKIGVMIETPAAVQIIEDLCKEGIDFISFGTNDLTQYTLALDRGNEEVQYLYDEMHPAVLKQLAYVIKVCKKYKVETSICGQAGSRKEMVEFLIKQGIDSISVNADKAFEISSFVKELEDKGLRGSEGEKEEAEKIEEKVEEEVKEEKEKEKETFYEEQSEKIIEEGEEKINKKKKENKKGLAGDYEEYGGEEKVEEEEMEKTKILDDKEESIEEDEETEKEESVEEVDEEEEEIEEEKKEEIEEEILDIF